MKTNKLFFTVLAFVAFATACDPGGTDGPATPSIAGVQSPAGADISSAKRGSSVKITGENLAELTSVKFNGKAADLATASLSNASVTVTIPSDTPLTGNGIEVANAKGGDQIAFTITKADEEILCINEVYYSNPDWIELYNGTDAEIDLSGYIIHDDNGAEDEDSFEIPEGTKIPAGGFLVFNETTDFAFGISSTSGDQLTLLNAEEVVVDDIILPFLTDTDVPTSSYGRTVDGGEPWIRFEYPTKGFSNPESAAPPVLDYTGVVINEVDGNGKFVELYNKTDAAISLEYAKLMKNEKDTWWTGGEDAEIPAKGFYTIVQEGEETTGADEYTGAGGISPKKNVKFTLEKSDGTEVDSFTRSTTVDLDANCTPDYGADPQRSFARCPDGTGEFGLAAPSCGAANPATSAGPIITE